MRTLAIATSVVLLGACADGVHGAGAGGDAAVPDPSDAGTPATQDGRPTGDSGLDPDTASTGRADGPNELEEFHRPGKVTTTVREYLDEVAKWYFAKRAERMAALKTPEQIRERQAWIRDRFVEYFGAWPQKTPLNAKVVGTVDRAAEGYRVDKVIYESEPDHHVTALMYVPVTGEAPYPTVVGVSGHDNHGKNYHVYQDAWVSLARRGFVVFAYDPPGQGERIETCDPALGTLPTDPTVCNSPIGGVVNEHTMYGVPVLLTGMNYARYEIWDGIRAVDYLLTRPEVDPKRLGVTGNSGGGNQSAYLAALEPRIVASAPSCYITTWPLVWATGEPGDSEQVFTNSIRDGFDLPDFALAHAPQPYKMLTATKDFNPIAGSHLAYCESKSLYAALGAADHMEFFEFDDEHAFSQPRRESAAAFFDKWFLGTASKAAPVQLTEGGVTCSAGGNERLPEMPVTNEAFNCTSGWSTVAEFKNERTIRDMNQELAESLYPKRSATRAKKPEDLRATVAARIQLGPRLSGAPAITKKAETAQGTFVEEQLTIETEPRFVLPASLLRPPKPPKSAPAVLYVGPRLTEAGEIDPDALALAGTGAVVLMIEPRGSELPESNDYANGNGIYQKLYQMAMRALLVKKTMIGMRATDILGGFEALAHRPDVDPARIALFVKGRKNAVAALHAAALEPRFTKVAIEDALVSYMDVVRVDLNYGVADLALPGVLLDYDLPDLARSISPRPLWMASFRRASGLPATSADAQAAHGTASAGLRILDRVPGASFMATYGAWLNL